MMCRYHFGCRLAQFFAAGLLSFAAIIKCIGLVIGGKWYLSLDPVFAYPQTFISGAAIVVELAVATACLLSRHVGFNALLMGWLLTVFLTYRVLADASGIKTCPCLGNAASWWPWLALHADVFTWFTICTMSVAAVMPLLGMFRFHPWKLQREE